MPVISTNFINRLKKKESKAWFDLWDIFGSSIERMIETFGHRMFSQETVRDISQETMSRVYEQVATFDSRRGVKFSTWVYTIAKHIVYSELRRRNAQKRNSGNKALPLEEALAFSGDTETPPVEFERAIFRAKVYRAIKVVESQSDFLEFEVYRLKISESKASNEIAKMVGVSESSVSRYIKKIRQKLKENLAEVVGEFSFTEEEHREIDQHRLNEEEDSFDEALAEIYISEEKSRKDYDSLTRTAKSVIA